MSLTELTDQLAKTFDTCLESILCDPKQEEGAEVSLDTHIATLKSTFVELESQLRNIRLKALSSKEISIQESNRLLKKDIEIKNEMIHKYTNKIEEWEKELPSLKERSEKAFAVRTDKTDFDPIEGFEENVQMSEQEQPVDDNTTQANDNEQIHQQVSNNTPMNVDNDDDDDDEDEDVEFEEI